MQSRFCFSKLLYSLLIVHIQINSEDILNVTDGRNELSIEFKQSVLCT